MMFDFTDLVKCCRVQYLYQKLDKKMIPTLKVGNGKILLSSDTNSNLSSEYYYRTCKYPKPKYKLIEQSYKLESWVNQYIKVNGI